jgi:hypothetical protein
MKFHLPQYGSGLGQRLVRISPDMIRMVWEGRIVFRIIVTDRVQQAIRRQNLGLRERDGVGRGRGGLGIKI